jgi:hypothetical protein
MRNALSEMTLPAQAVLCIEADATDAKNGTVGVGPLLGSGSKDGNGAKDGTDSRKMVLCPPQCSSMMQMCGAVVSGVRALPAVRRDGELRPPSLVLSLALHSPSSAAVDPERDSGRLYVGCVGRVLAFDLDKGERKDFVVDGGHACGIAVTEDGARLYVVQTGGDIFCVDTRTGVAVRLLAVVVGSVCRPV